MKVQELRSLLGKADRSYVEKAFAESYKQLTKSQKAEIDPVILDILEGKEAEKRKRKVRSVLKNWNGRLKFLLRMPMHRITMRRTV